MEAWIENEMAALNLGDRRLNSRCVQILSALSSKPAMSIPGACEGWSETVAAYRFFDNSSVATEGILEPHRLSTIQRISAESAVVLAQDTTILNVTRPKQQIRGTGPLSSENNHGMFDHVGLALTTSGVPLGVLFAKFWSRDWETFFANKKLTASEKAVAKRKIPFANKESFRWLEGYQQGCAVAKQCPDTQIVVVSDSEADVIDCFAYANEISASETQTAQWITRAYQNRALVKNETHHKLWEGCHAAPVLTTLEVAVSENRPKSSDKTKRNQPRNARKTLVEVRVATVTVNGQPRIEGKLNPQTINAVYVLEQNPPEGEKPVEWLLLTSLPVHRVDDALRVIEYYVLRWKIEIYFRILKVGCGVEELQFETVERYQRCLAVYMIVAWRVFHVMMLSRVCPEESCECALAPAEWKSLLAITKKQLDPKQPPTIGEALPLIAELGGYLGRKGDGPPGPQTTWLGMQRLKDFTIAWIAFGPEAQTPTTCV